MRKKVRKVLSVLLTVSMTASMFSGIAFAEGAGKLFDKAAKMPRLIISDTLDLYGNSEQYESAEVKLASDANAAIATASDAETAASPSDALKTLEVNLNPWEGGDSGTVELKINPYNGNDGNYCDYRATMSNATEKVTISVKAEGKTYQSEIELVCNWFNRRNHSVEPHVEKYELNQYWRSDNPLKGLVSGDDCTIKVYDLLDGGNEISDIDGWFTKETDKIILNTKAIDKAERTEKQMYRFELCGADTKVYGYCDVTVYPLPTMEVDGELVQTESVADYINGLETNDAGKLKRIKKLEITAGSMSSTDWLSIKKLSNLQSLTVSDDVEAAGYYSIPNSAFEGMKSLETVFINKPVENKSSGPRANDEKPCVQALGSKAFKDCTNLRTVSIPGINEISSEAFKNCTSLSDLAALDVTSVYKEVFSGCTSLKEVNFLNLEKIWDSAFKDWTGLEKIILPGIALIDEHAFQNCINLKWMDISAHAPYFWASDVMGTFEGVPKPLQKYRLVDVEGNPLEGSDFTDALNTYRRGYSPDGNSSAEYKLWKEVLGFSDPVTTNYTVVIETSDSNAERTEGNSLNACIESFLAEHKDKELTRKDITKITVSGNGIMTKEDWETVETLSALTWLQIGYEDSYNYNGLSYLQEEIPAGVRMPKQLQVFFLLNRNATEIPDSMFEDCTKLVKAYINNVTKIGNRAFAGCNSLDYLYLPETPPELGDDVFAGITERFGLYPISGNLDKYRAEIQKGGNAGQWQTMMPGSKPTTPPDPSTPDSSSSSSVSQTGQWKLNDRGWWYDLGNNLWPSNQWSYLYYNGRNDWYYFDQEGYMVTGWYTDAEGKSYYLHPIADGRRGYMYTGWNLIDGVWYYFSTESGERYGMLLKNTTTPDGYAVNENGAWAE